MHKVTSPLIEKKLKKLRAEINKQDRQLLLILKNRFKIVKKVALLKKKSNLPILQRKRWKIITDDRVKMGSKLKLDGGFILALMKLIHKESIRLQLSQQNKKDQ